jgi:integrase
MPRPRNCFPKPRCHKGAAVVDLYIDGHRRTVTLGPWGSEEAEREFARLMAERKAAPGPGTGPDLTVNEVLVAFLRHADGHYIRPDGTRTNEVVEFKLTGRVTRELYGHTPAREFGPLALKAVRQRMIDGGLARTTINARVRRLKHVFKWAAGEELVPVATYQALRCVEGLQKGRTAAPEPEPILPVPLDDVNACLPFLRPAVRAMVRLQLLTGMRPGEVCRLRPCDLDRSGEVWFFRPVQHKTLHRGKDRVVALGPRAQALLEAFAPADPAGHYFNPRQEVELLHTERTKQRKTPRFPSHMVRNAGKRVMDWERAPGEWYTSHSYAVAIARAVVRANRRRERMAGAGQFDPVGHWQPNQLRHLTAADLQERYAEEFVRAVLGHGSAAMTRHYARAADAALAAKVAAERG